MTESGQDGGGGRKSEISEAEDEASNCSLLRSMWRLLCSRFLTAWGDRLWAFGLSLLIIKLRPEDLTLVSVNGLVNCVASIVFGAFIGNWIDKTTRLRAAKTFLVIQNSSVALCCGLLAAFFQWRQEVEEQLGEPAIVVVATIAITLALVSTLASSGSRIVVEKDWIVVIAAENPDKLAKLNSIFRVIDLVCLTVTPTIAGFLFYYTSEVFVAVFIGSWNVISVFLEFLLLSSIYHQFPGLSKDKATTTMEDQESRGLLAIVINSFQGWKFYFLHHSMLAGLGLALLFMTVLGFDATTWAFILLQCVPEWVLGILVAVSALVGLVGALVFPLLRNCFGGVERTGVFGMTALVSSLSLCVASVWLAGSPFQPRGEAVAWDCAALRPEEEGAFSYTSVTVLLAGIILARFGLWIADLSITQVQQVEVEEEKRGVVGGVQNGLQNLFNTAKFFLVILMPDQSMFGILVILSVVFVSLGAISMATYAGLRGKLCCGRGYQAAASREEDAPKVVVTSEDTPEVIITS